MNSESMKLLLRGSWICLTVIICTFGVVAADQVDLPTTTPKTFQIRNEKYGDLLRPENANNANGTPIVLYPAQPWKCMTWKLYPAGGAQLQLQNFFTSKTIAPDTNQVGQARTAVLQVPFAQSPDARPGWIFTKLSDGRYKIADSKSGKALTALRANGRSTTKIVVEEWHGNAEQKWELIAIDPNELTM